MKKYISIITFVLLFSIACVSCSDDDDNSGNIDSSKLVGTWVSEFESEGLTYIQTLVIKEDKTCFQSDAVKGYGVFLEANWLWSINGENLIFSAKNTTLSASYKMKELNKERLILSEWNSYNNGTDGVFLKKE